MDDSLRRSEIEDRLAEMEIGLAGRLARDERALRFVRHELEALVEECRDHRDAWSAMALRAGELLQVLDDRAASG